MIPIILRLKKEKHREIARAQDIIVKTLFEIFENAVFHGGTCIWRCYKGNRFSEDIDAYILKDNNKINKFFEVLERRGLILERKKISEQSIFSSLKFNRTSVRFESIFKSMKGQLKDYEMADGNIQVIPALNEEELIAEKIRSYINRLKIRDLYDVFFLLRYVSDTSKIKKLLEELLGKFKNPIDEKDLKPLIIEGLTPKVGEMLNYIQGKLKDG